MSETWTIRCDGCGADLMTFRTLADVGSAQPRWLSVSEKDRTAPREDFGRQDFCDWACIAKYAAATAA